MPQVNPTLTFSKMYHCSAQYGTSLITVTPAPLHPPFTHVAVYETQLPPPYTTLSARDCHVCSTGVKHRAWQYATLDCKLVVALLVVDPTADAVLDTQQEAGIFSWDADLATLPCIFHVPD